MEIFGLAPLDFYDNYANMDRGAIAMSADFNEVFPIVAVLKRKPGRPRAILDPSQRRKHIGLAMIYFGSDWTLARIAKMHDVNPDTARRWIRLALNYNEPEADRLRIMAENSQRKLKSLD